MLGRWFKKDKLASDDAAVRVQGVCELQVDHPPDKEKLLGLARNDSALLVRTTALRQLDSVQDLETFVDNPELATLAKERLAHILDLKTDGHLLRDPEVLQGYLVAHTDASLVGLAEHLESPQQLAELCVRARGQEREQLFAHKVLRSESGLQALERASRNRDKNCNRHARVLLDAARQARQEQTRHLNRLAEIDEALTRAISDQRSAPAEPGPAARISQLDINRAQVVADLAKCHDVLKVTLSDFEPCSVPDSPLKDVVLAAPPEQTEVIYEHDDLLNRFEDSLSTTTPSELIANWEALSADLNPEFLSSEGRRQQLRLGEKIANVAAALKRLAHYVDHPPPDVLNAETDRIQAEKERRAWHKHWQSTQRQLSWPDDVQAPAEFKVLEEANQRIEQELGQLADLKDAYENELNEQIEALERALDDGHYKESVEIIKTVRQSLSDLPRGKTHQNYERKLVSASARLNELRDWQKFATLPKRQSLLEDLRKIADSPLDPPAQAGQLRHLRAQWRQLGPPSSRDERQLLDDFDALAEQAYIPCAEYYAEQEKVRSENLTAREQLCDQLEAYLDETDWHNADYKAAEQIMRTARAEWRKYHPCERKALKPVEQRFEGLQQRLHETLKNYWDRNIAAKERIVAEAQALLELEDSDAQANGAKALQGEWKTIGSVPRNVDQRLWRTFRGVCDEIFEQRKAAYDQVREQNQKNIAELEEAITQLGALLEVSPVDAGAFRNQSAHVEQLRTDTRLPRALLQRLEDIQATFRKLARAAAEEARTHEIQQLLDWDRELAQAENSGTVIEIPHPFFNNRQPPSDGHKTLHHLLLEIEIAADLPSPAEDQASRMALQVDLMNQGMRNTGRHDPHDYLKRWCAISKPEYDQAMHERLTKALQALSS